MSDLYRDCPTCGGNGDVITEAGYHDQCPQCSSYGVVPVEPAGTLTVTGERKGNVPGVHWGELDNNGHQFPTDLVPGEYLIVPKEADGG